jgi:hypothetical protein
MEWQALPYAGTNEIQSSEWSRAKEGTFGSTGHESTTEVVGTSSSHRMNFGGWSMGGIETSPFLTCFGIL